MFEEIILASKSLVRKKILEENGIKCIIEPSNIDEDLIKESLLKENANPKLISKNLAELKANKVSQKRNGNLVLGADSIINLKEKIISKPSNRDEALAILQKLNGQKHQLISSVCNKKNHRKIMVSIEVIEPLGPETLITVIYDNTKIVAKISGTKKFSPGDEIQLVLDMNKAHFFG